MKKTKRIVALLLAAVLAVGCLGFAAYAADGADLPTVVFDAQTKEFRFENCGPNGTDLFRDFKNAMPGDNLVQHIRVKVENAGLDTVKIMLRSGESNADYATLLGMKVQSDGSWVRDDSIEHPATLTAVIPQLSGETITVTDWFKDKIKGVLNLKDQTIDPYLYSGTLAEGVYLGAYSESSQQDITVTLAIPKSAGNELQGLTATVDWIFTAEVIPYNPPTPDIPDEPTPAWTPSTTTPTSSAARTAWSIPRRPSPAPRWPPSSSGCSPTSPGSSSGARAIPTPTWPPTCGATPPSPP